MALIFLQKCRKCFTIMLLFIIKAHPYHLNLSLSHLNLMMEESKLRSTAKAAGGQLTTGDSLLNDKYLLTQLIGKGSFGEVYRGLYTDKDQAKKKYPRNTAIKIENDLTKTTQLANEVNVLEALQKEKRNRTCFPRVYASGSQKGRTFMVMDLLGPNLQDLMMICGGKFSIKTALLLSIQIIQRIEAIHELGFVYRDIKPENFLMGTGSSSQNVYMVDFGLCKRFRDANTKLLVPYKEATSMVGTIRYSSLNSHLGIDQSRRDDLQSICYLLIYFIKGELPWQGLGLENKFQKDHMIMNCKLKISPQELCADLPLEIEFIFEYVKNLSFYEDPDYHYILTELSYLLEQNCQLGDYTYDWQVFEREERLQKSHMDIIISKEHEQLEKMSSIKEEESSEPSAPQANSSLQHKFSHFKDFKGNK